MRNFILITTTALTLSSCASVPQDPNHVYGVNREGEGIYSADEAMSILGAGSSISRAVKQCGKYRKAPQVLATTTKTGFLSDDTSSVILFKCQ